MSGMLFPSFLWQRTKAVGTYRFPIFLGFFGVECADTMPKESSTKGQHRSLVLEEATWDMCCQRRTATLVTVVILPTKFRMCILLWVSLSLLRCWSWLTFVTVQLSPKIFISIFVGWVPRKYTVVPVCPNMLVDVGFLFLVCVTNGRKNGSAFGLSLIVDWNTVLHISSNNRSPCLWVCNKL